MFASVLILNELWFLNEFTGHRQIQKGARGSWASVSPKLNTKEETTIIEILYNVIIGRGKYWRIWRIDSHLLMFNPPIFSLPVIYPIGAYFDNLVLELMMLNCCYIILSYIADVK